MRSYTIRHEPERERERENAQNLSAIACGRGWRAISTEVPTKVTHGMEWSKNSTSMHVEMRKNDTHPASKTAPQGTSAPCRVST
eukprot:1154109-Pelagomonas_calceolata.AAC.2